MGQTTPSTPEPVVKAAALQGLTLAVVNLVAFVAEFSAELTLYVNGVVLAFIVVVDVFWLRAKVTPTEDLHERLQALKPPEFP